MAGEIVQLKPRLDAGERRRMLLEHAEKRLDFELMVESEQLTQAERVHMRASLRMELLDINSRYPREQ